MDLYDIENRVKLFYKMGKDTLYIQKHLGLSFDEVMNILYPPTSIENFVGRMKEEHDLHVEWDDMTILFDIDDKWFDEVYARFDNERLIKAFNL